MKTFKLKDLTFTALIVVLMFVLGYILVPLFAILPIPAYRAIFVAPIYGAGITLAINQTKRTGTATIIGILIGLMIGSFAIIMFFVSAVAGFATDIIGSMLGGYRKEKNILIAGSLFPAIQIPLVFYIMAYTVGGVFGELIKQPIIILIPTIFAYIIAYISSIAVLRVWKKRKINSQL
ncbi:hypothetical protein [Alkaliphilus peptidifermentans]|uniref:Energy-coupling factor transport system substrate-specific component n=1 Tax=Alkaliphilus peptidifermentans DSM 18978 TaxID=1120976 RepID=A0A1G5ATS4_9FIRM|nr:hypothetical protein [Alkaliphilus peptidifermentans]SCX81229.1 hypothetical protein SAMN03080606_00285 [Alkaliphilus peptidifermentans DSM 18978]